MNTYNYTCNKTQSSVHAFLDLIEMMNLDYRIVNDSCAKYSTCDHDIIEKFISKCCERNTNSKIPCIVALNVFNEWVGDFWSIYRFRRAMISIGIYTESSKVYGLQMDCFMDITLL